MTNKKRNLIIIGSALLITILVIGLIKVTSKKDTSCTSQDTNGNKEITLVTCNNFNGNRLIIKAKE